MEDILSRTARRSVDKDTVIYVYTEPRYFGVSSLNATAFSPEYFLPTGFVVHSCHSEFLFIPQSQQSWSIIVDKT